MFGIGNDPFSQQDDQQDQGMDTGDQLVGRIMSAEYNLDVQRGDRRQASNVLGQMFGQWLTRKFGG